MTAAKTIGSADTEISARELRRTLWRSATTAAIARAAIAQGTPIPT